MGSSSAPTTAPAGADHPQEKRTCAYCKAEKVVTPESWPYRKGRTGTYQAHGARCMDCDKKRKAEYEKTRHDIVRQLGAPPAPVTEKATGKSKEKLDVAAAMKAGGIALNQVAPAVMAKMMQYLDDEHSEHHQWVLEFFAQRILPRKTYEEIGGQAAGVGALTDKRPQFIINVTTASPGHPGNVYENGEQPLLSAPAESEAAE